MKNNVWIKNLKEKCKRYYWKKILKTYFEKKLKILRQISFDFFLNLKQNRNKFASKKKCQSFFSILFFYFFSSILFQILFFIIYDVFHSFKYNFLTYFDICLIVMLLNLPLHDIVTFRYNIMLLHYSTHGENKFNKS